MSAGDESGQVAEVTLTVDHASVPSCVLVQVPYRCWWETHPANQRTYRLQAIAKDAAGNLGLSDIITVQSGNEPTTGAEAPAAAPLGWRPHLTW